MKIEINKKMKMVLIPVIIIAILGLAILFYYELTIPEIKEVKTAVYECRTKGRINYGIKLKPNILYPTDMLDEGGIYLSEFVDSVNAGFRYDFNGESEAVIKGKYGITAAVEGYYTETSYTPQTGTEAQKKAEPKIVWRKEYTLVPETEIDRETKDLSISKDISLKYSDYNDFALKIVELSKYKVSTRLIVSMNVNTQIQTDRGTIEDMSAQSFELALGGSSFSITKNEPAEKPGSIEEVRKIRIPPNKYLLTAYAVASGILLLALLFFIIFTRSAPDISEHLKLVNRIFKKYSNRMAVLCGELKYDGSCLRHVRTMEDLVRIADEMQKPVIYKYSENIINISQFFVFDGNWTYIFDLKAFLSPYNREHEYSRPEFISRQAPSGGTGTGADVGVVE